MNFLGDVGNKHAESLNVGMDYLTERNITWVFYKYNIKVNRYPEYEEKIRVKRSENNQDRKMKNRCISI